MRRIGHKGADLIVPGNTTASFDAALAAGVDMIEFDVLELDGRLLLAHDFHDATQREPHTLQEGLAHLAAEGYAGIELDVDLKAPGYENAVLEALGAAGLLERTLISSQYRESLALIRAEEPGVRLGWSVPKLRRDPFRFRAVLVPVMAAMAVYREALPEMAARAIRAGAVDAIMAHWRLVTPRLARRVQAAGGELYVWTVDEPARMRALADLGVAGVISNDPRLFASLAG